MPLDNKLMFQMTNEWIQITFTYRVQLVKEYEARASVIEVVR